jgi:hypothetical protein
MPSGGINFFERDAQLSILLHVLGRLDLANRTLKPAPLRKDQVAFVSWGMATDLQPRFVRATLSSQCWP